MLRYIPIIITALLVSSQPSVADININELAIKYPQCQDSNYRHECFDDYLYVDGSNRRAGYFRENLMWEGLTWEDGKLAFETSEGVQTAVNSCRKVTTWYHCPNGDKQKPLEGGKLVFNKKSKKYDNEGKWTYHHADGAVFVGNYKNNAKNGYGKYTWAHGDIYEGNWENNARNGFGKYTWEDSTVYEGNWENNAKNGYGKMTYAHAIYEGNWKNNVRHGYGKYTLAHGAIYEGNWKDGKLH